ncbi:MAG: ACT domain-containing protein [Chloroflexi bacterium]|nr:ACT domain-containing protein [Chloroflexota bacterium]
MSGETDLKKLLQSMQPERNAGEYVFCVLDSPMRLADVTPLGFFREREGVTVILPRADADQAGLSYAGSFAWLTLTVHSSLEAVGLTAAFSHALSEAGISCNVVAAFHHDHIFVPVPDVERALTVLRALSEQAGL